MNTSDYFSIPCVTTFYYYYASVTPSMCLFLSRYTYSMFMKWNAHVLLAIKEERQTITFLFDCHQDTSISLKTLLISQPLKRALLFNLYLGIGTSWLLPLCRDQSPHWPQFCYHIMGRCMFYKHYTLWSYERRNFHKLSNPSMNI